MAVNERPTRARQGRPALWMLDTGGLRQSAEVHQPVLKPGQSVVIFARVARRGPRHRREESDGMKLPSAHRLFVEIRADFGFVDIAEVSGQNELEALYQKVMGAYSSVRMSRTKDGYILFDCRQGVPCPACGKGASKKPAAAC